MENNFENKINYTDRIINYVNKNKKIFITIIFFLIILLIGILYIDKYQNSKNREISEKFIKAGIYLSSKNKDKSNSIYKEIILSKNKFYSLLALNNIIDNELETNSDEILKLFEILESINLEKEQKNLIKLKKALYLIKISRNKEGNDLLKELISDNSIWKNTAEELL